MNYIVFEAGSRAGFSALIFFLDFKKSHNGEDNLILVDSDKVFIETIRGKFENVYAYTETEYDNGSVVFSDLIVFPADELKRQKREVDSGIRWYNEVEEKFYNKKYINQLLCKCGINVPKTFECHNVFIRPNTYSAGSKGVYGIENVSVTEKIDIENEYVVDAFCHRKEVQIILSVYPREVVLRNGYDKYIKFLPSDSDVVEFVKELVQKCDIGLFNGVFNVQIVRSRKDHKLYYIESSKRISGTSCVNLLLGYNPFCKINELELEEIKHNMIEINKWYSYEQLLEMVYGNKG